MSNIDLSTFPSNKTEAIAYLYVLKKDYENPTPALLAQDYMDAYKEVRQFFIDHSERSNWSF